MRLRAIRQQQGLSLQGVEEKSDGLWKAGHCALAGLVPCEVSGARILWRVSPRSS